MGPPKTLPPRRFRGTTYRGGRGTTTRGGPVRRTAAPRLVRSSDLRVRRRYVPVKTSVRDSVRRAKIARLRRYCILNKLTK